MLEQDFGVHLPLEKVCQHTQQLLGQSVNVLFFDCTTLYFESFTEDDLKQNGYSKDCKFNQPQVLLALMVSQEGLPMGYEVFPEATFEGHTLIPVIASMRKRYALDKVICVADRGMLSKENLQALKQAGAYYIVGDKLKVRSDKQQALILDRESYRPLGGIRAEAGGTDGVTAQEIAIGEEERLIVSHCPTRARKDQHDREEAVSRLLKKLGKSQNPKTLLNNYGYKRFLEIEGETSLHVNQDKIIEAARWDGLHGVITNIPDMCAEELLNQYRGLWQVEESFRISKHDLKIRPIYHWTPRRVRAHIALSFMAFSCVRHLMYRVKLQQGPMSAAVIRRALVHVQHSILKDKQSKKRYVLPSRLSVEAKKIYRVMGIEHSEVPYRLD